MTRQITGPGTDVLERDYVYADPPISITDLALKYGLARSNVAQKAMTGKWFEKRQEWRQRRERDVREALAEKWAETQVALYERLAAMSKKYLDRFEAALDSGEIKVSTKDMLGIAAMMRTLTSDVLNRPTSERPGEDDDVFDGSADEARAAIEKVRALLGEGDGGE